MLRVDRVGISGVIERGFVYVEIYAQNVLGVLIFKTSDETNTATVERPIGFIVDGVISLILLLTIVLKYSIPCNEAIVLGPLGPKILEIVDISVLDRGLDDLTVLNKAKVERFPWKIKYFPVAVLIACRLLMVDCTDNP